MGYRHRKVIGVIAPLLWYKIYCDTKFVTNKCPSLVWCCYNYFRGIWVSTLFVETFCIFIRLAFSFSIRRFFILLSSSFTSDSDPFLSAARFLLPVEELFACFFWPLGGVDLFGVEVEDDCLALCEVEVVSLGDSDSWTLIGALTRARIFAKTVQSFDGDIESTS